MLGDRPHRHTPPPPPPEAFVALVADEDADLGQGFAGTPVNGVAVELLAAAPGSVRDRARVALIEALGHLERGRRRVALEALIQAARELEAVGDGVGSLLALLWAGRVELLLGHRRLGLARTESCATAAAEAGLDALVALAARSKELDLLRQISVTDRPAVGAWRVSLARRARALEAFHGATCGGDELLAEACLDAVWRDCAGPDYVVERLLVIAGRAFLDRRRGRTDALHGHLRDAACLGAEGSVDADNYLGLAARIRQAQTVVAGRRAFLGEAEDLSADYDVVLDSRSHDLRAPERGISFRRRPIVRKLLYVLAAHAGQPISKDALTRAAWGVDYNPLLHEYGLRVNITHLRRLIEPAGLSVRFAEVGYRLEAPPRFAFIETVNPPVVR